MAHRPPCPSDHRGGGAVQPAHQLRCLVVPLRRRQAAGRGPTLRGLGRAESSADRLDERPVPDPRVMDGAVGRRCAARGHAGHGRGVDRRRGGVPAVRHRGVRRRARRDPDGLGICAARAGRSPPLPARTRLPRAHPALSLRRRGACPRTGDLPPARPFRRGVGRFGARAQALLHVRLVRRGAGPGACEDEACPPQTGERRHRGRGDDLPRRRSGADASVRQDRQARGRRLPELRRPHHRRGHPARSEGDRRLSPRGVRGGLSRALSDPWHSWRSRS